MHSERLLLIGSERDLHRGYHGALVQSPPKNIRYSIVPANHLFLCHSNLREGAFSPHRHPHFGEFLDFGNGNDPVHSSRFPVVNRSNWIVDMDDFGSTVLGGRYLWNPQAVRLFRERNSDFLQYLRMRARWMLTAYAHPSCKGIFFWTERGMSVARRWLSDLNLPELAEEFLAKCHILYPSVECCSKEQLEEKWKTDQTIHIVFCGRDFQVKNGDLTVRIFSRLAERFANVAMHYVGRIPSEQQAKCHSLREQIYFYPELTRSELNSLLVHSHILFHPSRAESFGMILLEAAAAGMALVTAKGPRMRHVEEFFGADGAMILDRSRVPSTEEEPWYEDVLASLIADWTTIRRMGLNNYELARSGKCSRQRRDAFLSKFNFESISNNDDAAFRLESLPRLTEMKTVSLSSRDVYGDWVSYRKEISFQGCNLYV